jgi:uncharacterized protein YecT (DUF1311 family)
MLKTQILKLGIMAIAPFSLLSFPSNIRAENINCKNPQSGPEITYCAQIKFEQADQKLNQVYQQKLKNLTGKKKQQLIKAQTQWIKDRDKTCDNRVRGYVGKTGYGQALAQCLEELTNKRIKQLKKQ